MAIGYPVVGGMASIQIGSFLDQTYEVTSVGEADLGDGPVRTTDLFTQDGQVKFLAFTAGWGALGAARG